MTQTNDEPIHWHIDESPSLSEFSTVYGLSDKAARLEFFLT